MIRRTKKSLYQLGFTLFLVFFCFISLANPVQAITTGSSLTLLDKNFTILPVNMSDAAVAQVSIDLAQNTITVQGFLPKNERLQLSVSEDVSEKIKWRSSNGSIAAIDTKGRLRILKSGQVKITATGEKSKVSKTIVVKIEPVLAQQIAITTPDKTQFSVGTKMALNAIITPSASTEQKITWQSSDSKIASVNRQGVVQVRKSGQVTITAKLNAQLSDHLVLTVAPVQPQSLEIMNTPKQLEVGKTVILKAKVKPASADQAVFWESSNPEVAAIEAETGRVHVVGEGMVTFTAKTRYQKEDGTPWLTVQKELPAKSKLRSAALNTKTIYLQPGESYDCLKVIMEPSGARTVTFRCSQPLIATVDENGVVTAASDAKKGKATSLCVVVGDKEKTLYCKVIIKQGTNDDPNNNPHALQQVKASATSYKMDIGKSRKINYRLIPSKTIQRRVQWVSMDEQVATVDADGVVKAVGQGEQAVTQIVGTFENGQTLTYTITIKPVIQLSTDGITFERKLPPLTLKRDETATIYAQVKPQTNQQLSWKSSSKYIELQDNGDGSATLMSVLPTSKRSATATIQVKDNMSGKYLSFRVKLIQ